MQYVRKEEGKDGRVKTQVEDRNGVMYAKCTWHHEWLPFTEFYSGNRYKYGIRPICKECLRTNAKRIASRNKAKIKRAALLEIELDLIIARERPDNYDEIQCIIHQTGEALNLIPYKSKKQEQEKAKVQEDLRPVDEQKIVIRKATKEETKRVTNRSWLSVLGGS